MNLKNILFLFFAVVLLSNIGFSATYVVNQTNPGCMVGDINFETIYDATEAATVPGDTIIVCPESTPYIERVEIATSINIYGYGAKVNITNDSRPDLNAVITIFVPYVNISNFTVFGETEGSGIEVRALAHNSTIENITSYNNKYGFYLNTSNNNTLISNEAYNNTLHGLSLYDSNNNTLISNEACNNTYGFYIYNSSGNYFVYSWADNNTWEGFILGMNSENNTLERNNSTENFMGFFIDNSNFNNLLDNNASANDYGFYIQSSVNITLLYNNASENSDVGFYLTGF
ncbi:MAG: NosD domain-containing protein [Candidatus ainarchaeum sp.]|nr:NosD domain-containing protein [Candidatus ainarchaeum sp.]